MSLICRLRGHAPDPDEICNAGRCFSRCLRCGADLVQEGEEWKPVPKGYRVVWKDSAPAPAPPPPAPPPYSPEPTASLVLSAAAQTGHILVCDDDPLVTDLLAHKLEGRGYRVTVAADGEEALKRLREERPDAVLLDAMMPMLDGYEVLRRIRADASLAGLPVIMLTARKQEGDIVGALGLGASDFVVKPFIPEELLSRLARLMAEA